MSVGNNGWMKPPPLASRWSGHRIPVRLAYCNPGAVEESNVDLTGELVKHDRAATQLPGECAVDQDQDQIMQTMVNLR